MSDALSKFLQNNHKLLKFHSIVHFFNSFTERNRWSKNDALSIPERFSTCQQCQLQGSLSSIGNWKNLNYLDVSYNNLTGQVPPDFKNLTMLTYM